MHQSPTLGCLGIREPDFGGWNNRVKASKQWLMAIKVLTLTYKSLSPAVVICHWYVHAFIRRADVVKAPRQKWHFQWLMSAPTPRWPPPQTSPHHHACTHPSPSLIFLHFPYWGVISGTVSMQFHTKGREKKATKLSIRQSATFVADSVSLWLNMQFSLSAVRTEEVGGSGCNSFCFLTKISAVSMTILLIY